MVTNVNKSKQKWNKLLNVQFTVCSLSEETQINYITHYSLILK